MAEQKAWVGFDLDGTLAEYDRWEGVRHIGKPIPKMIARVKELLDGGASVKVFTARVCCSQDGLSEAQIAEIIESWCLEHIGVALPITNQKDFACIAIYDDRSISIEKNTGESHALAVLRKLREKATEHYTPALRVMAVPVAVIDEAIRNEEKA